MKKSYNENNAMGGAVPKGSHAPGSADVTRGASQGPGLAPNQTNPDGASGPQAGSWSNVTGKKHTSKEDQRKRNSNKQYNPVRNDELNRPPTFKRYFVIKSKTEGDLRRLNIFKLDREIERKLKGEPAKTYGNSDGSLTIEAKTKEQSEIIPTIETLLNEEVIVEDHRKYNESQ